MKNEKEKIIGIVLRSTDIEKVKKAVECKLSYKERKTFRVEIFEVSEDCFYLYAEVTKKKRDYLSAWVDGYMDAIRDFS